MLHSIKKLKEATQVDIDLNDLSVVDAGTSENYLAMAKLMVSEGREVVALLDGDKTGDEIEKQLKKVCEKEVKEKRLQIHRLPKGTSIEDIFADVATLWQAAEAVANDLITAGIRKLKTGISLTTETAKIVDTADTTLGRVIDTETPKWFDPEEKLSKLSIALKYEDIVSPATNIPEAALAEVEKIKAKLSLKGESNDDKAIFAEV